MPPENEMGLCVGDSGGPAFVPAADVSGYRADEQTRAWQAAHAQARPFAQVGVLSTIGGGECEGASSEFISIAA